MNALRRKDMASDAILANDSTGISSTFAEVTAFVDELGTGAICPDLWAGRPPRQDSRSCKKFQNFETRIPANVYRVLEKFQSQEVADGLQLIRSLTSLILPQCHPT